MKKMKWRYWAGGVLLAAGLLAGCGKAMPPAAQPQMQEVQEEESRTAENQDAESDNAEEAGSLPREEEEDGGSAEAKGDDVEDTGAGTSAEMPEELGEDAFTAGNPGTDVQEGQAEASETPEGEEAPEAANMPKAPPKDEEQVAEDGTYTSKEEVAQYLHLYGHLPDNFITKKEAKALGWVSSEGNLGEVAPGKSIGGDYFGNYEGNLPEKEGRDYHECDIDSDGGYRGAKRIVYSNDGLIYYTEDHYNTFELLYGEE